MSHKLHSSRGLVLYDEIQDLIGGAIPTDINWTQQNQDILSVSTKTGNTLRSIKYANSTWMAVGSAGTLITSANNGVTWINKSSILGAGSGIELTDVAYGNGRWFVVGYSNFAAYSDDNGDTWTIIDPDFGTTDNTIRGVVYAYYEVSPSVFQHRWIMTGGGSNNTSKISLSTDNGINWNISIDVIPAYSGSGAYLQGIDFNGINTLVVAMNILYNTDGILISTDGGSTWSTGTLDYGYWTKTFSVKFSNGIFMAVGYEGAYVDYLSIYTSTSGIGSSWTVVNITTAIGSEYISDISFSSVGNIWICTSSKGRIFKSSDNGVSWTEYLIRSDIYINTNSISSNGSTFISCSDYGYMFKSSDSGVTWISINSGQFMFKDIIYDGTKWVTFGDFGFLSYSTNGKNWTNQNIPLDIFGSFSWISDPQKWSIANNGTSKYILMRLGSINSLSTSNDLINWSAIDLTAIFNSIQYVLFDDNRWLVNGQDLSYIPSIGISTDGTAWTEANLTGLTIEYSDTIYDVAFNGSNLWMLIYYDGSTSNYKIATSSDNAATWTYVGLSAIPNISWWGGGSARNLTYVGSSWYFFSLTTIYDSISQTYTNTIYINKSDDDGITWTGYTKVLTINEKIQTLQSVKYNGTQWIMILNDEYYYVTSYDKYYLTSTDGITWSSPIRFNDDFWPLNVGYGILSELAWNSTDSYWMVCGGEGALLSSKIL